MKRKFRIIVSMLLVVVLFVGVTNVNTVALSAQNIGLQTDITAEEFVMDNIEQIYLSDQECPWDENTQIASVRTLYDYNYNINGYIYTLVTNGKSAGYMQIFDTGIGFRRSSYSYYGTHYIEDRLVDFNKKVYNKSYDREKVIYLGAYSFWLKASDSTEYYDLYNRCTEKVDIMDAMVTDYNALVQRHRATVLSEKSNSNNTRATQIATVSNFSQMNCVNMGEFEGQTFNGQIVDNHCAPTAGVNLIRYWGYRRGISGLIPTHVSGDTNVNWWIFTSLCVNMGTNFSSGTTASGFYNGIRNYCTSTRGVQYDQAAWWGDSSSEECTFAKAKNYIDSDVPFKISIKITNDKNHAMACFGYRTNGSTNELYVMNGEGPYPIYEDFSEYNGVNNYQFINWY